MSSSVPDVSVVIGSYNGGDELKQSIESVLQQTGVELEMIVVDDGSTDGTDLYLRGLKEKEPRVRTFRQDANAGLTLALIRGCREARGKYIARQDVGDRSLPERLRKQFAFMEANPEIVLSSCWTRTVGPGSELLSVNTPTALPCEATRQLRDGLYGVTHHGATMFRRDTYVAAGGYREAFYFAQDLDLWYRLTSLGYQAFVSEILYENQITPQCISSRYRDYQIELASIIHELNNADAPADRKEELLTRAAHIRPNGRSPKKEQDIAGTYWIASMLIHRGDMRATKYLVRLIRRRPLWIKAWIGLGRLIINRTRIGRPRHN